MDCFRGFVIAIYLGAACAGVVRRDAPDAAQELDSSKVFSDLITKLMAATSQFQSSQSTGTASSSQSTPVPNSGAGIPDVQNMFRNIWPNNGSQVMDYDLSQVMQMMNASYGIPQVADSADTSSMNRSQYLDYIQNQTNSFSKMLNSDMALWLEPNRVVKYLNISRQMYDPSVANNSEAQAALERQYQDFMADYQRSFRESVNEKKPSETSTDPASSAAMLELLQTQMSNMASMYNRELSTALKPEDIQGALGGDQFNSVAMNLENAVMNIFKNISQSQGPYNGPLKWQ